MFLRAVVSFAFLVGTVAACHSATEKQQGAPAASEVPTARQLTDTLTPPVAASRKYPYTVPPIDQVFQQPALQSFVQKILRACAARRQADLLALVDDSVAVSAGGGIYGKPGFITDFLNNPRLGSGFEELQQVIKLGGTVAHDSAGRLVATFPYLQDEALYQGRLANVELDPFISYVSMVPGLIIYEHPSHRSRQLLRLDYPVLFTGYDAPELGRDWLRVVAVNSSFRGYAEAKYLYCLAAMTLSIEQKKGQFKITSVIPYD